MKKITLLLFAIILISCQEEKKEIITKEKVLIELGKKEILSRLKAPSTAKFVDSVSRVTYLEKDKYYVVTITCDSQNSYGAMLRKVYKVVYTSKGLDSISSDNYKLKDIF